jgi:hypothetical protein
MTSVERYSFGDNNQYYYEFKFHRYSVPGSDSFITTVMLISTNVSSGPTSLVDPYIPDFIQFMAKKCIEYNANYDGFHNHLEPYEFDDSADIAEQVNVAIEQIKNGN